MEVLFKEKEIQEMVERVAQEIVNDYGEAEIVLIFILNGASWFGVDLSRAIESRRRERRLYEDSMEVFSYGEAEETSGNVRIMKDIRRSINGKDVIIVDDVCQTGLTQDKIIQHLLVQKPKSLKTCVAVDKVYVKRLAPVKLDYIGLSVKNEDPKVKDYFLAGYGMDYKGTCRGLKEIVVARVIYHESGMM